MLNILYFLQSIRHYLYSKGCVGGLFVEFLSLFYSFTIHLLSDPAERVTVVFSYNSTCLRRIGGDSPLGCWSCRCFVYVIEEIFDEWTTEDGSGARRGLKLDVITHLR